MAGLDDIIVNPNALSSISSLSSLSTLPNIDLSAYNGLVPTTTTTSTNPLGSGSGLGLNLDTLKLGLTGLSTVGNLYAALQANSLAKKQFNFTKAYANANMSNQVQSYNTTLADRLNSRAKVEGTSAEDAAAEIAKNSLKNVTL